MTRKKYDHDFKVMIVELLVNGQKYASKVPNDMNLVVWEGVVLKEGVNHIVVKAEKGSVKLEDECYWTLRTGL